MRNDFASVIETIGKKDKEVIFLTGDLGFNAFEGITETLGNRFINAGVAEQNMVSVASGMAYMGLKPWVYSIAPFITLKTAEQVRDDMCHQNLSVKLVGNGGGYGYGIMGATHHVLEDISIFASFPHMRIYVPAFQEDIEPIVKKMYKAHGPAYLRLGSAEAHDLVLPPYQGVRRLMSGNKVTMIVLGPLIHNTLTALRTLNHKQAIDLWCITEFPFTISDDLMQSIRKTKHLIILEEHTNYGGLGQTVLSRLVEPQVLLSKFIHLYAQGYPSHLYGSQKFHLQENQLDPNGILENLKQLL